MTFSGTPSRAISTAWAWRSWWGAKRRRTPAVTASCRERRADRGGCPWPPRGWSVDDAQQRADGQLHPAFQPGLELLPAPAVHARLAALAALTLPHEKAPARNVEVAFGEGERLADPESGAPQQHDQGAGPEAVRAVASAAHHRNDLLNAGRIGGVAQALVARWATAVVARQRGGRAATPSGVDQDLGAHAPSVEHHPFCDRRCCSAWKAAAPCRTCSR